MNTPKWTLKKVKTSDLKDYYKNPRSLSEDQANHLKKSVDKFGLIDKPIVNQDLTLIGGHQRKKVYSGEEIEVWFPDRELDEKEVEELNIRLNANTGSWDYDILKQDWNDDELTEWGLDLPDFLEKIEPEENEDDIPDITQSVTEKGDLWELNNHRLLCGDSCNVNDIDKLMNGQKADCIFTDPPYDLEDNYTALILDSAKDNCHVFIMDGDVNSTKRAAAFDSFRKYFVCDIRIARMISNNQPMQRHTLIAEFKKKDGKRFNNLKDGFTTLIESATDHKTIDGFNQHKRVQLPETFILHYSKPNELIADFFCGAGSTLIASEKNNRNCYLMEFEPRHCDITIKRWINYMTEHSKLFEIKRNGEKINHEIFA